MSFLKSIHHAQVNSGSKVELLTVVVDDRSSDGTADAIHRFFPSVEVVEGSGSLYWAGGMRFGFRWIQNNIRDYSYLVIANDDIILCKEWLSLILFDLEVIAEKGVLVAAFTDPDTGAFTYGGRNLQRPWCSHSTPVIPNNKSPQKCHLGNGNFMVIPRWILEKVGFFSETYTHGLADFDFSMKLLRNKIPLFASSVFLGSCANDHKKTWLSSNYPLRERIRYLRSVKGLASSEYLRFIFKYFPICYPYFWLMLWAKTFFPFFWDYFKTPKAVIK